MVKARKGGVNTPTVLLIEPKNRKIYMQYIESTKVRDFLINAKSDPKLSKFHNIIFYFF